MKMFVTVGAQLPFDRLIRTLDELAARYTHWDIEAQVGESEYQAKHIQTHSFLGAGDYALAMGRADVMIAHAGMGSIIQCLEVEKPLIVVPRRSDLGEHRNDHQFDTIKRFAPLGGTIESLQSKFQVAHSMEELEPRLRNVKDLSDDAPFFISASCEPQFETIQQQQTHQGSEADLQYHSQNAKNNDGHAALDLSAYIKSCLVG